LQQNRFRTYPLIGLENLKFAAQDGKIIMPNG
jgi:hypothetical protein